MSRTDNTDPYWVRATVWKPFHVGCPYAMFPRGRACDLAPEPIVEAAYSARWRHCGHCVWAPAGDGRDRPPSCPRDWIRVFHTGPERRRVRDQLTRARAEYRGTGEVDVVASTEQHRHQANWNYW